jgi:hypothetical protein
MKLSVETSSSVGAFLARELAKGEKAVTISFRQAGEALKADWRGEITRGGLGQRLARTIRSRSFPRAGNSINAAALVWSNAPVIVGAHAEGPLIRSRDGFWLAIPTPAAGKGRRGGRITPGEFEKKTGLRLRFVYRRGAASLLVAEGRLSGRGTVAASRSKTGRGVATVPVFVLVPQTKLAKRLDLARSAARAQAGIPSAIVRNWLEDA